MYCKDLRLLHTDPMQATRTGGRVTSLLALASMLSMSDIGHDQFHAIGYGEVMT